MNQSDRELFLGFGIHVEGRPLLERCFDPTPARRSPLAAGEAVGEGDYVLAETDPRGARVRERLATSGSALAAVYALAVCHGLNPVFPPRVMADADALRARPGIDDPLLADLTELPFCTIDGPTTRDLDQALHVEALATGFRLHYALADAAWFAPLGSALFAEALRRASSFYLPGLTIPMLPRLLSEDIVSLAPAVARRALVMVLELDADGQVSRRDWVRARIRSRAKLAFGQVARMLAGDAGAGPDAPALLASLAAFRDLGETLARRRDREGVVRYRRDEVDLTLIEGGRGLVPVRPVVNPVERWNEEVSVLCNTQGACFLLEGDNADDAIEPIYRVHPAPPPAALAALERRLAGLVALRQLAPAVWTWQRQAGQSLADYLRGLPVDGEAGRLAQVVNRQAVITNLRATYSAEPAPHAGVGAEVYGRFTAPMREIVGIFLHHETIEKQTGAALSGASKDRALRQRVIDGANRARELQSRLVKDLNRAVIDALFRADLDLPAAERPRRRGTVMGLQGNRLYCLLDDPPLEVKVYTADVAEAVGEPVAIDPDGIALRASADGRVLARLGDRGRLDVRSFDAPRDRWVFGLLAD
jgi:ribonuclease R